MFQQKRTVPIQADWVSCDKPFLSLVCQLKEYFVGKRHSFEIPMRLSGSPFQLAVWDELMKIPYGSTITYGDLAKRIGNPKAARAVGLANGQNPIPIIVPCHRVIGASGKLTGFGGGVHNKELLLNLEKHPMALTCDQNGP
jgi:methylated-DNA-[protein]-cysteine S-methyltransferase